MVQIRTPSKTKYRRDAWLEVNLEALESNLQEIYRSVNKPLMPVVKANAYGHGASIIAPILEAYDFVDCFGVASLDEALELREAGIRKEILVLGICPTWAFEMALENDISLTLVDPRSAEDLNHMAKSLGKKAKIHLKFETGMNRIGFSESALEDFLVRVDVLDALDIQACFSHFADVDDEDFSNKQFGKFKSMSEKLEARVPNLKKHIASSASARIYPETFCNLVRCGIELYGYEASPRAPKINIKPLMSLYARIAYVKEIDEGESVSYLRKWKAPASSVIATVPIGYADGIPRALSNKLIGYLAEQKVQQVGLITMDQIMFDVTGLSEQEGVELQEGSVIELLGPHISIQDWADELGTISYELLTNLNLRLSKIYTRPE